VRDQGGSEGKGWKGNGREEENMVEKGSGKLER
jgi:hypothetical protein